MNVVLLTLGMVLIAGCTTPRTPKIIFGDLFEKEGFTGTLVIYDARGDRWYVHNEARSRARFLPASTFKIPNSLFALTAGVVTDKTVLPWDKKNRFYEPWNHDMDMAWALRHSAVWFYQELARRIGEKRMQEFLNRARYGNRDLGGGIDRFWLSGALRISAREQITFLRALHAGTLPFPREHMATVKRLMIREEGRGYTIRAKTGWAVRPKVQTGWYVGWVERKRGSVYFAVNIETRTKSASFPAARIRIAMAALKRLGVLPASAGHDRVHNPPKPADAGSPMAMGDLKRLYTEPYWGLLLFGTPVLRETSKGAASVPERKFPGNLAVKDTAYPHMALKKSLKLLASVREDFMTRQDARPEKAKVLTGRIARALTTVMGLLEPVTTAREHQNWLRLDQVLALIVKARMLRIHEARRKDPAARVEAHLDTVVATLGRLITRYPVSRFAREAILDRALATWRSGDTAAARKQLLRIVTLKYLRKQAPRAAYALGWLELGDDKPEAALRYFVPLAASEDRGSHVVLRALVVAYARARTAGGAPGYFRSVAGSDATLYQNLIRLLMDWYRAMGRAADIKILRTAFRQTLR